MSCITDELRTEARGFGKYIHTSEHARHLLAIADRIDAAHEEALVSSYFKGVFSDEELAENGFMRLPKDAGGVTWTGKETHFVDAYGERHKLLTMAYSAGIDGWYLTTTLSGAYRACGCRHHHAPTVEDVLREFAEKITDSQIPNVHPTYEEAIAEYTAKLRLAESENQ